MRRITMSLSAAAAAGALLFIGLAPASAEDVSSTISGGDLTASLSGAALSGVTLNGTSTQIATGTTSAWSITDARGTGAAWSLSVSATDLKSAPGTAEVTERTIPVSALSIATGVVTAEAGSDPATGITTTSPTLTAASQALISAPGAHKGTYTVSASTFSLAVPANAYRSNYSGAVGSSSLNPYVSTVTFTIG
jgi:WxL domain surface cell wall-binding